MLITLSGLPGSGTSTVAKTLASRLGIDHLDGGTVFRSMASEHGLGLAAFARLAESDDSIDRQLDQRLVARAREGNVVLESRLAGWLCHHAEIRSLRVWIQCDERERARRVGAREGHAVAESLTLNRHREASERTRYLRFYQIDLTDLSIYDMVLDSTIVAADQVVEAIIDGATAAWAP